MKKIFFILLISTLSLSIKAQIDSTEIFVETKIAVATQGYLTQWLGYNQYGLLDPNSNDGYLRASVISPLLVKGKWTVEAGVDGILKPHDIDNSFVNLAYGHLQYGAVSIKGGRYLIDESGFNHELSSGHLFRSINTRPNWRIGLGIYEFADLPWTQGYVQVKGYANVGFLEDERPVTGAKYHEKSAYIRSNKLPINIILGLNHSVIFDGVDQNGNELPGDFLEAFFASNAVGSGNVSDSINAAGAHFGLFDIGFEIPMKSGSITTYFHQPIADKSGFQSNFTANKDYVLGIEIKLDDHSFIKSLLYENIYTLHQSGPGTSDPFVNGNFFTLGRLKALPDYDRFIFNNYGIITEDATWPEFREIVRRESNRGYNFSGRDDYYNNSQYPRGNTFLGQQIGTSLFTTQERFLLTTGIDNNFPFFIINNRIQAHHIGMKGKIKDYDFKFLATLTNNFGTYGGFYSGNRAGFVENPDYFFRRVRSQQSLLFEVSRKLSDQLSYEIEMGADFGDFGNNLGFSARIRYQLR